MSEALTATALRLHCITVDGQTAEDGTVTVRHRDSMEQERVKIGELHRMVEEECSYRKLFKKLNL